MKVSPAYAPLFGAKVDQALGVVKNPNVRVKKVKGQAYYRVAPGDTLASIARKFKRTNREAGNLLTINKIPVGTPLRAERWILIPTVWADPSSANARRKGARALMGCISCNKNKRRGPARALGASWWEAYDECPAGMIPVFDDEGDIIDCVCGAGQVRDVDFWGNPTGCLVDNGDQTQGGEGEDGDDGFRDPSEYLSPDFEKYETGIWAGYYDDRDGSRQRCPEGSAYFEDYFACLPYEKKGGGKTDSGGGKTNGGGGSGSGGGGSGSGGGSTTSTAEEKKSGIWEKIVAFFKKPIVIGGAIAVLVVGGGIIASKKRKKLPSGG